MFVCGWQLFKMVKRCQGKKLEYIQMGTYKSSYIGPITTKVVGYRMKCHYFSKFYVF
jgi:hypothetical protein